MKVTVLACESLADVAAVEATLPTGASAFHRQRYERGGRVDVPLGVGRRTLEPVDVWSRIDDEGVEHEHRDPCTYWTRASDA